MNSYFPIQGHEGAVLAAAFRPGNHGPHVAATGGRDRLIKFWDTSGAPQGEPLVGHEGTISDMAFSPNGMFLVSGGEDSLVYLWDIEKRTPIAQLRGHRKPITAVAFSRDGQFIATGSLDKNTRIWDLQGTFREPSGNLQGTLIDSYKDVKSGVTALEFISNSRMLIKGGEDGAITSLPLNETMQFETGVHQNNVLHFVAHNGPVHDIALNPTPRADDFFASAGKDGLIRLWNIRGDPLRAHS